MSQTALRMPHAVIANNMRYMTCAVRPFRQSMGSMFRCFLAKNMIACNKSKLSFFTHKDVILVP